MMILFSLKPFNARASHYSGRHVLFVPHQPLWLESCSNLLRMRQVFLVRLKKARPWYFSHMQLQKDKSFEAIISNPQFFYLGEGFAWQELAKLGCFLIFDQL